MKTAVLEDIGRLTGGNVIGEEYGTSLTTASFSDLGSLDKVVVTPNDTTFKFKEGNKEIDTLVTTLQDELKTADKNEIGLIKYRLNLLTGKLATIKVGAITETALRELHDRVDDSVHATKCALQEGILPGGGVTLKDISLKFLKVPEINPDDMIKQGEMVLYRALLAPLTTILANGGFKYEDFGGTIHKRGWGVNVLNGKEVNVKSAGIIDPTKVTKNAVINAVDVVATILSTDFIVTNLRQDEL